MPRYIARICKLEVKLLQLSAAFACEMVIIRKDVIKYDAGSSTLRWSAHVIANTRTSVSNDCSSHHTRPSHFTGAYLDGNPTDTPIMRVSITRRFSYWVAKFLSRVSVNVTHETIVTPDTLYNMKFFLAMPYHVPRLCKVYDIFSNQWGMENNVKWIGRIIHRVYRKQLAH